MGVLGLVGLLRRVVVGGLLAVCVICGLGAGVAGAAVGRGFEMASPLDKAGIDVEIDGVARASSDGQRVVFESYAQFAPGGGVSTVLARTLSARGAGGWVSRSMDPPYARGTADSPPTPARYLALSDDLTGAVGEVHQIDPVFGGPTVNISLFDLGSGSWTVLSRPSSVLPDSDSFIDAAFAGGTADFGRVVFESSRALTPDVLADPRAAANDLAGEVYLYEWSPVGRRLVSVLDDGEPALTTVGLGLGKANNINAGGDLSPQDNAISADGSHIFFSTNTHALGPVPVDGQRTVYVRSDPDLDGPGVPSTVRIDVSERSPEDPAGDKPSFFQGASVDGSKAFVVSGEKLTGDAMASGGGSNDPSACLGAVVHSARGCDLYRWDAGGPVGGRLRDLTIGDAGGAGVVGVVGASGAGDRVYFVAAGVLGPGPGPVADEPNLYVWQEGLGVRFIATLDDEPGPEVIKGGPDFAVWDYGLGQRARGARVSGDGRFLLFRSRGRLTGYETARHFQVYLYDSVTGVLSCVSCNRRASVSSGDAWLKRDSSEHPGPDVGWVMRNITADSTRVFFDSAEALVEGDTNGRIDVYEYEIASGAVRVVSDATKPFDSAFIDAGASGDDVFFATRSQLACQDTDQLVDIYDARVGGGIPCKLVPACQADDCQGNPTIPPALAPSATSTFHGQGNSRTRPKAKAKKKKAARKCRKRHTRSKSRGGKTKCRPKDTTHKPPHTTR